MFDVDSVQFYHSSFIFHPMSEQTDKESQVPPPLVPMGSSKRTSRSPCMGTLILTLPSSCCESRLSFFLFSQAIFGSAWSLMLLSLESLMWAINLFIPTCYIGSAISLNIPPLRLINIVKWDMQMMEQKPLKVCVLPSYSGDYGHVCLLFSSWDGDINLISARTVLQCPITFCAS